MPLCPDGKSKDGFPCSTAQTQSERSTEYQDIILKWKGGKKDSIDDILNGIGAPAKKDEPKKEEVVKKDEKQPPPADAGGGKKLTKEEVSGVVKRSYGSVQGCANDKVRGKTATVRFTINSNGSVGAASVVTADVASDPAAGCILRVVRGMKFPAAEGSMTINYPFKL